ncbi:unnamed protein product [Chrysoparadoxa australica]
MASVNSGPGDPRSAKEANSRSDAKEWQDAMEQELASIKQREVWELADKDSMPASARELRTKFIFKLKHPEDPTRRRYKARLVVMGNTQVPGVDFTESFSPVAMDSTIRMVLALANHRDWEVKQFDVEVAFLNANLEEPTWVRPPDGISIGEGKTLRLRKALYGLVQAPLAWMRTFVVELKRLGFERSRADPCLMIKRMEGGLVILVIYVDDCLAVGFPKSAVRETVEAIGSRIKIDDMGDAELYLGFKISRDREQGMLRLHQKEYLEGMLQEFGVRKTHKASTPGLVGHRLDADCGGEQADEKQYRSGVGKLMYAVKTTRPDLANATRELAKCLKEPKGEHMLALERAMQYVSGTTDLGLTYSRKGELQLEAFVDADYAGDVNNRRSTTGFLIMFGGAAVSWKSKLQPTVSLSSSEAEYRALSECGAEVAHLHQVGLDIGLRMEQTPIYEDNTGAISLAENWSSGTRTKHVDVRYHHVREMVESKMVKIKYIRSEEQPADILTKNSSYAGFARHRNFMLGR